MTDTKKPKRIRMTTPKGVMLFPWLNKPDTKFNPEGKYKVTLRLSQEAGEGLVAKLQPLHDKVVAKAQKDPKRKGKKLKVSDFFTKVFDDNGDETGEFDFTFKMTASGVRKSDGTPWSMRPDLYDAHGQKLPADTAVWGGSTGKVNFEVVEYDAPIGTGISLRLNAVQVVKLVTSGDRDASAYGFGDESDDADATDEGTEDDEDTEGEDF